MIGNSLLLQTTRLRTENLSCSFGRKQVLHQVSLSIAPGEVMCLLGPSGCGKSTTLRVVAGVERQSEGEVWLDGRLLSDPRTHLAPEERGVGLMFQDFALFPHLSVANNIAFGLSGSAAEKSRRVGELLERVDLAGFAEKSPHQLSGGEQQRVALARALAPRPSVMLMDEPFSGLDDRLRDGIRDETLALLKEEGTAVLLVTHEPEEAMRMADQILLMREGRVVQQGAPYELYHKPADRDAAAFFSDINLVEGRVSNGMAQTLLGDFVAPGLAEGALAEVVFRPQHVSIDFDRDGHGPNPTQSHGQPRRALVERARFMGHESLVEFRLEGDETPIKASVPAVFLPKPGKAMWLSLDRAHGFVFEKTR